MPRDYEVYLEDIRDAIGKVKRYTTGLTQEAFENDDRTVDAVVRAQRRACRPNRARSAS